MNIRLHSKKLGKKIRAMTGMNLYVAIRIAKMILQGKFDCDIVQKFPDQVKRGRLGLCDCCCDDTFTLVGSRDKVVLNYSLSEFAINQAFDKKFPASV